jgi:CDP-diacylglycerol--glycerol-3-phosphate 3-phosphatidyltransferase
MIFKKHIPKILLYSRLFFFFTIVALIVFKPASSGGLVLLIMYLGIITDIFDGIIARKLNLSSKNFRLLDTVFDLLFYLSILYFIFSTKYQVIIDNQYLIAIILTLEASMYCISLARFRKLPSPHAIMSKFWGLYIVIEFTLILLGIKGNHFTIALCAGLLVHIDRVLIYILLPHWDLDIPSSYHALLIRQGKSIKKNKLFNG